MTADHCACHPRIHDGAAMYDLHEGRKEGLFTHIFEEAARCASLHASTQGHFLRMRRENHNRRLRVKLLHALAGGCGRKIGQTKIEKKDIRSQLLAPDDRLLTRTGFAGELEEPTAAQQQLDPADHNGVVVNDHHRTKLGRHRLGSHTRNVLPPSSLDVRRISPPRSATSCVRRSSPRWPSSRRPCTPTPSS